MIAKPDIYVCVCHIITKVVKYFYNNISCIWAENLSGQKIMMHQILYKKCAAIIHTLHNIHAQLYIIQEMLS